MFSEFVVVIDPYSSGTLLVDEFKRRGYNVIGVQSVPELPAIYRSSSNTEGLTRLIIYEGNLQQTAEQLRPYHAAAVIPGCDLGVGLADALGCALGLPGNDSKLAAARLNKFEMVQVVLAAGLRTPAQVCAASVDDILAWVRGQNPGTFVLKPPDSTGSDAVHVCSSEQEIRNAFDNIIGRKNALGRTNPCVLAQAFLSGVEFVVDTVSFEGQHSAAAFWTYRKSTLTGMIGPECIELLPYAGEIQRELFNYAKRVLDALGIRYGAAHIELMWSNGKPVLVELGARVNGGGNPLICWHCTGSSQVQLLADAYLESNQFIKYRDAGYILQRHGMRVFLIPHRKGEFRNTLALDKIRRLRSFQQLHLGSAKTWDSPRRIGWVILMHADPQVVEDDLHRIRELEDTELYSR